MSKLSKSIIIHYCNSPTRYLHGLVTEIDHQNLPFSYRLFLPFFKWWLRLLDLDAVNNLNKKKVIWVGNSKFCSQMIKNIYKTDSQVIYPPIELDYFFGLKRLYKSETKEKTQQTIQQISKKKTDKKIDKNLVSFETENKINLINDETKEELEKLELIQKLESEDYYYYFGRISFHKRLDLTILACLYLGKKIKICGASAFPAEMEKLKNLVLDFESKNMRKIGLVEFLGRLDNDKRDLYLQYCRGFIFPAKEDFGIAPVEVLASGTPIIAYKAGGALEYVIEKKSQNISKNTNSEQNIEPENEKINQIPKQSVNQKDEQASMKNENQIKKLELKVEEFENNEDSEDSEDSFNGVFFDEQTVESLSNAILEFEKIKTWNTDFIRRSVLKFDQKYFKKEIETLVENNK